MRRVPAGMFSVAMVPRMPLESYPIWMRLSMVPPLVRNQETREGNLDMSGSSMGVVAVAVVDEARVAVASSNARSLMVLFLVVALRIICRRYLLFLLCCGWKRSVEIETGMG